MTSSRESVGRPELARFLPAVSSGLTEKTGRNSPTRIYDKLGLSHRSQIVALYMANGHWHG